MIYNVECDWCHKPFTKNHLNKHNFCCRQCLADFSNKNKNPDGYRQLKDFTNISKTFKRLNPELNKTKMTPEIKEKIRVAHLNSGEGVTYTKYYGRHEHRIVAEQIIGRPLKKGEVVHHRDGDKRNNSPENILVFASQSEHAKHHAELRWFIGQLEKMEGGDAQ